MKDLANRRILVTGGARGIGKAIAERFAKERAELLLSDVDVETATATAQGLAATGVKASAYRCDVTDLASILALRDEVNRAGGPIDVLVNNAGVVFGGSFLDVPLERHLLTYRVNTLGLVAMTHAFLPDLIGRPEAHVVNIASASGLVALPYGTTYASSKWSVIGFSDSLRLELEMLGHRHVKVTTVCPSYVATGLFEGAKAPLLSKLLRPEQLAGIVVDAVGRDRGNVLEPFLIKTIPPLKGVLPRRMFEAIAWWLGATSSMKEWKGHAGVRPAPKAP